MMRARARAFDVTAIPAKIRPYLTQHFVTPESEYNVYALSVFEGLVMIQIVNDVGFPAWRPAWAFDFVDRSLPDDWMCSVFAEEPSLVLGPAFIAASVKDYEAMAELEADKVHQFWQRVRSRHPADEERARGDAAGGTRP